MNNKKRLKLMDMALDKMEQSLSILLTADSDASKAMMDALIALRKEMGSIEAQIFVQGKIESSVMIEGIIKEVFPGACAEKDEHGTLIVSVKR